MTVSFYLRFCTYCTFAAANGETLSQDADTPLSTASRSLIPSMMMIPQLHQRRRGERERSESETNLFEAKEFGQKQLLRHKSPSTYSSSYALPFQKLRSLTSGSRSSTNHILRIDNTMLVRSFGCLQTKGKARRSCETVCMMAALKRGSVRRASRSGVAIKRVAPAVPVLSSTSSPKYRKSRFEDAKWFPKDLRQLGMN